MTAACACRALLLAGMPFTPAPAAAVAALNLGLSAFIACWCLMLTGGLWFGFWIRQEGLLLTQLLLAGWGMLGFLVFNLPWRAAGP